MKERLIRFFSVIFIVVFITSMPVLAEVLDDTSYVEDTNKYNNVPRSYYEYANADTLSTYLKDSERINGSFALAYIDDNDIPDLCWKKYREGREVTGIVTHLNGKEIKAYAGTSFEADHLYMIDYYYPYKCSYMTEIISDYNDSAKLLFRDFFYIIDSVNTWLASYSPYYNKYMIPPADDNYTRAELESIVKAQIGSTKRVKIKWYKNNEENRKRYLYDLQAPADSITLSKTSITLTPGKTETLKATASGTVTWKSSDDSVATVNNGKVTAIAPGKATITASVGSASAQCTVKVEEPEFTLLTNTLELEIGETGTIKTSLDGTGTSITWKSLDTSIATVSGGKVTGKKVGSAKISATANGKTLKCTVTVVKNETVDLSKFMGMSFNNIKKKLSGLKYYKDKAEVLLGENPVTYHYLYNDYCQFSYDSAHNTTKTTTILLNKNIKGVSIMGATIGMKKKEFTQLMGKKGFKKTKKYGNDFDYVKGNFCIRAVMDAKYKIKRLYYFNIKKSDQGNL